MSLLNTIDFICVGPLVQISLTPNTIISIRFFKHLFHSHQVRILLSKSVMQYYLNMISIDYYLNITAIHMNRIYFVPLMLLICCLKDC